MSVLKRRIELLQNQSDKLRSLLQHPEPGLVSWLMMVAEVRTEIDAIMDGEQDE